LQYLLIAWKPQPRLLRHHPVADPDAELSVLTAGRFDINSEFFLE